MDTETLNIINEGLYEGLWLLLKIFALFFSGVAAVYLAVTLSGIAWLCYAERRQPARLAMTPQAPEPDAYDMLVLSSLEQPGFDEGFNPSFARRGAQVEPLSIYRT